MPRSPRIIRRSAASILDEAHAAALREVEQAIAAGLVAADDEDGIAFQYDYTFDQVLAPHLAAEGK
jgi:hypothetical protein